MWIYQRRFHLIKRLIANFQMSYLGTLEQLTKGEIRYFGEQLSKKQRQDKIGYVPQDIAPIILNNVDLPAPFSPNKTVNCKFSNVISRDSKMLAGLEQLTKGEIRYFGEQLSKKQRQDKIGYVPQDFDSCSPK
jgi:ABC-type Mn2+/Zn2+ transport system ATPase subunit